MIFKHELRFVAFTWPNLRSLDLSLLFIVLVGCNFVSGIFKLKPKKPIFCFKKTEFFYPALVPSLRQTAPTSRCDVTSRQT